MTFQAELRFDGQTYDPDQDHDRLKRQLTAVWAYMRDAEWHSLAEIAHMVQAPEASVSARLRDLRKAKFGGYRVERQRVREGRGLYHYRLTGRTDG